MFVYKQTWSIDSIHNSHKLNGNSNPMFVDISISDATQKRIFLLLKNMILKKCKNPRVF